MKIAITGHTRGLGQEFQRQLESLGHTVDGFSRSNGYDLRDWSAMMRMLDLIQSHDMFISVAKPDFSQTTILYQLWQRWCGQDKTILNISTVLTYMPTCMGALASDPMMDAYRTAKVSLNEACVQLSMKSELPRLVLVKPCHLYGATILPEEQARLSLWVETLISISESIRKNKFVLKEITF